MLLHLYKDITHTRVFVTTPSSHFLAFITNIKILICPSFKAHSLIPKELNHENLLQHEPKYLQIYNQLLYMP